MILAVDGVAVTNGGSGVRPAAPDDVRGVAILKRFALTPGAHTISLQWKTRGGANAFCSPASAPDDYHASLAATIVG